VIVVAGHLQVAAAGRDAFVARSRKAVELARNAPGCHDFAVSADSADPERVNIYERWTDRAALQAFRGDGPDDELNALIVSAAVDEFEVQPPPPRADSQCAAARLRTAIDLGRELTALSDRLTGTFVADARAAGMSWADIGRLFGTSKQSAMDLHAGRAGVRPERWTAAAQETLARAWEEAHALGHDHVGTEHALLALASAEQGAAGEVLLELGVTRQRMLATSCLKPVLGSRTAVEGAVVMPRLKQALDHGRRIADGLKRPEADSEHLLAGIIAVSDSMAVEILRRLGVTSDKVRAALARRLNVPPEHLRVARHRRRRLLATRAVRPTRLPL
jgi:hypothetical protein